MKRAARSRPHPPAAGSGADVICRRAGRRADAPVRVRAGQDQARPEHHRPGAQRPQAAGRRLDRRLPPQPRAPRRQRPARRRDPPAPRRLDDQPRARVRRRGGEDGGARARGLRLASPHDRRVADEPHDPQPDARRRRGVHHLRARLHPRHRARGRRDEGGAHAVARHRRRLVARVRRQARRRWPRRPLHVPGRGARRAAQRLDGAGGRRARGRQRPPPSRRPVDGSRAHPRGAHGAPVPLRREVPRAGRGGVLGRVDDGDAARLEGPVAPR